MGLSVGGKHGHIGTRSSGVRVGPLSMSTGYGRRRGGSDIARAAYTVAMLMWCIVQIVQIVGMIVQIVGRVVWAALRSLWWLASHLSWLLWQPVKGTGLALWWLAVALWWLVCVPFRTVGWGVRSGYRRVHQPAPVHVEHVAEVEQPHSPRARPAAAWTMAAARSTVSAVRNANWASERPPIDWSAPDPAARCGETS